MTRRDKQLRAYFAGILDGEGTVGLYRMGDKGGWSLRVAVSMTDPRAVELLHETFPEGKFYKKQYNTRPTYRPYYVFSLHGTHAERFLREIKPFVVIKWEQVKLALSFLAYQSRYHAAVRRAGTNMTKGYPEHFHRRAKSFAEKIKQAKEPTRVNSVNPLREYRAKPR